MTKLTVKNNKNKNSKSVNKRKKSKTIFKKEDFLSNDGMLTYVWGPSLWHFLHTMSFNYPVNPTMQDKKRYMNFIKSLRITLPCRYCRENLNKNLKATHFNLQKMKNRETFSRYIYDLHNHINTMLGKKNTLKYDEVRERYENFRSRCSKEKTETKKYKCFRKQLNKKVKKQSKKEKGCVNPINGVKSKCIIRIVPKTEKTPTFVMDSKCKASRD